MSNTRDDNHRYELLTKRLPLRPIRDDSQNERAAKICDELLDRIDSLSQAEQDYLEVLTDLIAKYESAWNAEYESMSPRDLIQYLMAQNRLAQKDLVSEFGSPSRVSEFLNGERRLSLEQAKRLAERFSLNIAALLERDAPPKAPEPGTPVKTQRDASIIQKLSLKDVIASSDPMTYKSYFEALTGVTAEKETFFVRLSRSAIEEEDFARVYCRVFNQINVWLIVAKSSRNEKKHLAVAESIDVDSYIAFLRPKYSAWENEVRRGRQYTSWRKRYNVVTYGDFLRLLSSLAEADFESCPKFWTRRIDPEKGQAGLERFIIDLYEHLSPLVRKK